MIRSLLNDLYSIRDKIVFGHNIMWHFCYFLIKYEVKNPFIRNPHFLHTQTFQTIEFSKSHFTRYVICFQQKLEDIHRGRLRFDWIFWHFFYFPFVHTRSIHYQISWEDFYEKEMGNEILNKKLFTLKCYVFVINAFKNKFNTNVFAI